MKNVIFYFMTTLLCCIFSVQIGTAQSVSYLEVPSWSLTDLNTEQSVKYQKNN